MSFTFNGVSSDSKKFNVTSRRVFNAPAYDVNAIEVPGRSGDILNPQNRYKNKDVSYTGFLRAEDFSGATVRERLSNGVRQVKAWLCAEGGEYHELTDDYDPGYTRIGYCSGETAIEEILDRPNGVTLTVTFRCKPFIYKTASDITLNASASVTNPLDFPSLPRIEITMSAAGTLLVGSDTWSIGTYSGTLIVDSELMDWYDTSQLQNSLVTGAGFPVLQPGSNLINWSGGISKVKITPRWRTL